MEAFVLPDSLVRREINCKRCGIKFTTNRSLKQKTWFCSSECRDVYYWAGKTEVKCPCGCGHVFNAQANLNINLGIIPKENTDE